MRTTRTLKIVRLQLWTTGSAALVDITLGASEREAVHEQQKKSKVDEVIA
jgi:hypothetical protein